ncbi:MAG: hypothetical protein RLZZ413_1412 [Pseudomonadota bacterium]
MKNRIDRASAAVAECSAAFLPPLIRLVRWPGCSSGPFFCLSLVAMRRALRSIESVTTVFGTALEAGYLLIRAKMPVSPHRAHRG